MIVAHDLLVTDTSEGEEKQEHEPMNDWLRQDSKGRR
jgi:hypothetical protein